MASASAPASRFLLSDILTSFSDIKPSTPFLLCWKMVQEWSHVGKILSAYENTPRQGSRDFSFIKTWNCPWNVPLCSARVQQTGVYFRYSLLLAALIQLNV